MGNPARSVKLPHMRLFRSLSSLPYRSCLSFLCLLLTVASPAVGSDAAEAMFAGEIGVADESSETRNRALSALLADVLKRVSGNTGVAAQPAAKSVLAAAPSLVQQYRYRSEEGDGGVRRILSARFDRAGVERMMREQGLPVWNPRPRVLLWLASEEGAQRTLLNLDDRPTAKADLQARAQARGMPLQLPLLDLQDQAKLTAADLWSGYAAAIREASARYPHDVIAVGRLTAQSRDKWRGAWSLIRRDGEQTFDTPAQPLGDVLAFAVDQVQNLLAARYAPMAGTATGSGTLVRISAVDDLAGYARVLSFVEELPPVASVAVRAARDDTLYLDVSLRGDRDELERALGSGSLLTVDPGIAQPGEPAADLFFRVRD